MCSMARFDRIITNRTTSHLTRLSRRMLNKENERPSFDEKLAKYRDTKSESERQELVKFLSSAWCLKELCYKACSNEQQRLFRFNEWYKISDANGRPVLKTSSVAGVFSGDDFLMSLSHDGGVVMAVVLRQ